MGYSYGYNEHGRLALACDNCPQVGGVRKRRCRFKVWDTTLRSVNGERHPLDYCPAPALCDACYRTLGFAKGVHGEDCRQGAERSQAKDDADQARLDAGEYQLVAATGDWHELVPEGMVGLTFGGKYWGRDGDAVYLLVSSHEYSYPKRPGEWLSDYEGLGVPWEKGEAA